MCTYTLFTTGWQGVYIVLSLALSGCRIRPDSTADLLWWRGGSVSVDLYWLSVRFPTSGYQNGEHSTPFGSHRHQPARWHCKFIHRNTHYLCAKLKLLQCGAILYMIMITLNCSVNHSDLNVIICKWSIRPIRLIENTDAAWASHQALIWSLPMRQCCQQWRENDIMSVLKH